MIRPKNRWLWLIFVLIGVVPVLSASGPRIALSVDASEAPRRIFHAQLKIPATAGTLTLYYPKWIPGEHGPSGPIQGLTALKFTAKGQTLNWRRDLLDGYTFHVEVPAGTTMVDASLDYVSPPAGETYTGLHGGACATDKLMVLSWNTVLLYPAGSTAGELTYEASVRLPQGWKFGTALPLASQSGDEIRFAPASLTTLVDSTLIAGQYLRTVPLATDPMVEMDIAADSPAALEAPSDYIQHYKELVAQARKLFGAEHYRDYHFLYTLSDHVGHGGLEHHESNDSRVKERTLVDPEMRLLRSDLLPHEYVHSWNGKYRRPADLVAPDYQKPLQDDLLWVYEGLTEYLGDLLAGRSGLLTLEQSRDALAQVAAEFDHRPGRTWRNLQDTADGVPVMQGAPHAWTSWRRGLDYYDEDVLNWLWVDTIIQEQTQRKKSIDDFCRLFHGGQGGTPELKTYAFEDVLNALNEITPYDWRGFWTARLQNHGPGAPLAGITGSGWKLVYDETRSEEVKAAEETSKTVNAEYSIGLTLDADGQIVDTIEGMPAAAAGIGPGMKVVAVNGRRFTADVLREGLRAAKTGSQPMQLLIENTDYFKTYNIDYQGGEKYPHLVRDESKPDLLSGILKPR
jgi:predicted metalloprotease with PDZ domain